MPSGLSIPSDVLERAVVTVLSGADIESVQMMGAKEAAKILNITPQAFRNIAVDHFDFGGRKGFRWSLKDIKALAEKRRVKARR